MIHNSTKSRFVPWTPSNLSKRFRRTEAQTPLAAYVNTKQSLKQISAYGTCGVPVFTPNSLSNCFRRTETKPQIPLAAYRVKSVSQTVFGVRRPLSQDGFDLQPNFYVAEWHTIGPRNSSNVYSAHEHAAKRLRRRYQNLKDEVSVSRNPVSPKIWSARNRGARSTETQTEMQAA